MISLNPDVGAAKVAQIVSVDLICLQCRQEFSYLTKVGSRLRHFCAPCVKIRLADSQARSRQRLQPRRMDGTSTMSLGLKVERSLTEVAAIMGLSRSRVEEIEKQAFHKIRQDPELCELWADYLADVVEAQAEPSGYKRLIVWWD